ncbi:YrbL family protein [Onishia taeanensis]
MLKLKRHHLLGAGNERECFIHPEDPARCIKVNREGVVHRSQNRIEYYYMMSLAKRHVPFRHLPKPYGWVQTSQGPGLMFERVLNEGGTQATSLADALEQRRVSQEEAERMLDQLFEYLMEHSICLGDVNRDQVLVKETKQGRFLVLIDGLGTRRFGIKLYLVTYFKWLARRKTSRNWHALKSKLC